MRLPPKRTEARPAWIPRSARPISASLAVAPLKDTVPPTGAARRLAITEPLRNCTVPPSASLPYWTDPPPRTTSMASMGPSLMKAVYRLGPGRHVDTLKRTPSSM